MRIILITIICFILFSSTVIAWDLSVRILNDYKEIHAGDNIWFKTDITDMQYRNSQKVRFEYLILNEDKTFIQMQETKYIEVQSSFLSKIRTPNLTEGTHILRVSADDKYHAEDSFIVKRYSSFNSSNFYLLILIIAAAIFGIIFWTSLKLYKIKLSLLSNH